MVAWKSRTKQRPAAEWHGRRTTGAKASPRGALDCRFQQQLPSDIAHNFGEVSGE